jgi:hypothetical protein
MKLLDAKEQHKKNMEKKVFADFYNTRPILVRQLIEKYPWEFYRMKKDAPYGINPEGTKVELLSYRESGEVSVAIESQNLTSDGKKHLKFLCEQYNKDYDEAISVNHRVVVNPMWLEPITETEYRGWSLS